MGGWGQFSLPDRQVRVFLDLIANCFGAVGQDKEMDGQPRLQQHVLALSATVGLGPHALRTSFRPLVTGIWKRVETKK